jgi:hypothetical protein
MAERPAPDGSTGGALWVIARSDFDSVWTPCRPRATAIAPDHGDHQERARHFERDERVGEEDAAERFDPAEAESTRGRARTGLAARASIATAPTPARAKRPPLNVRTASPRRS